jgi:hypothetical protein
MGENIAIIGTWDTNAAYIFTPVNNDETLSISSLSTFWTQLTKLTVSMESNFGSWVAVARNWIVVGAHRDDRNNGIDGIDAGAVFVFTTTSASSSWTQMTRLVAADGATNDLFGMSVSISKDASTIVVGAFYDDSTTNITDSVAAYLFRNTNSSTVEWTQVGKFVSADPETNDHLGTTVAIEDNIVVVGADGDDNYTGAVYVLDTGFPPTQTADPTLQPTTKPPVEDYNTTTKSDSSGVTIAIIVVSGVVIAVIIHGLFNYRLKREAQGRHQSTSIVEPTPPESLPPSIGNNISAAISDDEAPIMANVIIMPATPIQPIEDRTMVAGAFVDPTIPPVFPVARKTTVDALEDPYSRSNVRNVELPRYKDQACTVAHGQSGMPSVEPRDNHHRQQEEEKQEVQENQPSPAQQP